MENLEEALDFYLGGKSHIGNFSDVEKSKIADDSKPESKIWKLIDKWKKQGLAPKFEICAGMLKVWGVDHD